MESLDGGNHYDKMGPKRSYYQYQYTIPDIPKRCADLAGNNTDMMSTIPKHK
jgi:hypothetical protein